jgi:acyl-CoA thioesterase
MGTLREAINLTLEGEGFAVQLDPEWEGWGPAGGYLAAIALRSVAQVVAPDHRPVTLQGQFLGKAEGGNATVRVELVKPGKTALANVTLSQAGKPFFQAQIWTTSRSNGPQSCRPNMPLVPAPETLSGLEDHFAALGRSLVRFWSKLDCRPIEFRAPGGPQEHAHDVFEQAARAAILIDANIWAAHWRLLDNEPDYSGPSLDLTVWFHDLRMQSDWLLLQASSPVALDGVVNGTGHVWTADGHLIATGGGNCLVVPMTR